MITFACGACGHSLKVAPEHAGKRGKCPRCQRAVTVPNHQATMDDSALRGKPIQQPRTEPVQDADAATLPPPVRQADTPTVSPPIPPGEAPTLPPSGNGSPPARVAPTSSPVPGYEILGELGRGGMGVVYKARQMSLRRVVALKMVLAGEHASADALARFRIEAEAIARLGHPNIVQVHEVGEHQGRAYFSLEFVEGGSLSAALAKEKMTPRDCAGLLEQLARAVDFAHKQGIIHRDLKPANILLSHEEAEDGTTTLVPKITDFGLAKQLDEMNSMAAAGPKTQSGAILGTPAYMAPEQAGGKTKDIGPSVDIYALGAILYEMLVQRPPFQADTMLDTLIKVATEEPEPPTRLNKKIPRDLETICLKCLQKSPGQRYATAGELADDLRRWLNDEPIQARPQTRVEKVKRWVKKRKEIVYSVAGALLVACLGLGLLSFLSGPAKEKDLASLPEDLRLIPRDAFGFVSVRVADLWERRHVASLENQLELEKNPLLGGKSLDAWATEIENLTSLHPRLIERIQVILLSSKALDGWLGLQPQRDPGLPENPLVMLTTSEPYEFKKIRRAAEEFIGGLERKEEQGRVLYSPNGPREEFNQISLMPISDRILLAGRTVDILSLLDRAEGGPAEGPLRAGLDLVADNHQIVWSQSFPQSLVGQMIRSLGAGGGGGGNFNPILLAHLGNLTETQNITLAFDLPGKNEEEPIGFDLNLAFRFANEETAKRGTAAAEGLLQELIRSATPDNQSEQMRLALEKPLKSLRETNWQQDGPVARFAYSLRYTQKEADDLNAMAKQQAEDSQAANRLKMIAIAMHNYESSFNHFPPAIMHSPQGKPLFSWRVALLPYLEQDNLYRRLRLDEPWDSPHNKPLLANTPNVYIAPWQKPGVPVGHTFYQAVVGPGAILEEKEKTRISSIPDGLSLTLMVYESAESVHWAAPGEPTFGPDRLPKVGRHVRDGFYGATGDGAVRFFRADLQPASLRAFCTRSRGERLEFSMDRVQVIP